MNSNIKLEELFYAADKEISNGNFTSAVEKLENILVEDPKFGKAYNHLGWLYETKFKDLDKAKEFYTKAVEFSPNYTSAYYNFAILLSTLGHYDELQMILAQALTVPGIDKGRINNEYGIMHEQMGDFENAIKYYRECIKFSLNNDEVDRVKNAIERCKSKIDILK